MCHLDGGMNRSNIPTNREFWKQTTSIESVFSRTFFSLGRRTSRTTRYTQQHGVSSQRSRPTRTLLASSSSKTGCLCNHLAPCMLLTPSLNERAGLWQHRRNLPPNSDLILQYFP
eukprot:TRINITY_DN11437_c0_g1::TRINITY_DN11437_c0_g1_i1::g.10847::m.10847 TRINITY_DN11437_c0_g1::TRINITY_DN11437_c0_g1_i1::g.10847  ORF type:complete len:115 (-),score=-9.39,GPS/PF01825.16/1.1e+04,GPS/PF01825.16/0.05 TRINITY_DN11437_c0_g1_i1:107-451(-)